MMVCEGKLSKDILKLFTSDIGSGEFFSYVGNMVSIEQVLAVLGILSPDFIEYKNHVFWRPNALECLSEELPLIGFKNVAPGHLQPSTSRFDVERYQNNFSISQFFSKWEGPSGASILQVDLSKKDYELCYIFAQQLEQYWLSALSKCFPDRYFKFEIGDNFLGEFGVCLTFWQCD